ncbi:hypothetical protein GCM10010347_29870 [Streptomyces cirratus]|uniref:Uncharacterized protein n=1 Tax=Streptomyces cirratus TaxID=68187 RepID=A0ABQ3EUL4_9ACTN|nr:hypothetical protein GCM10010347_29870 [Streptomyces cirratus]
MATRSTETAEEVRATRLAPGGRGVPDAREEERRRKLRGMVRLLRTTAGHGGWETAAVGRRGGCENAAHLLHEPEHRQERMRNSIKTII